MDTTMTMKTAKKPGYKFAANPELTEYLVERSDGLRVWWYPDSGEVRAWGASRSDLIASDCTSRTQLLEILDAVN